jgi:hypothetical protein
MPKSFIPKSPMPENRWTIKVDERGMMNDPVRTEDTKGKIATFNMSKRRGSPREDPRLLASVGAGRSKHVYPNAFGWPPRRLAFAFVPSCSWPHTFRHSAILSISLAEIAVEGTKWIFATSQGLGIMPERSLLHEAENQKENEEDAEEHWAKEAGGKQLHNLLRAASLKVKEFQLVSSGYQQHNKQVENRLRQLASTNAAH